MIFISAIRSLAILFFLLCFSATAQSIDDSTPYFEDIAKDVRAFIDPHYNRLNRPSYGLGKQDLVIFNQPLTYSDSLMLSSEKIARVESDKYKSDVGLRFSASLNNNFSNGFEDLGFFYRRSLQTGLDWNLLQNGWLENSRKSKEVLYKQNLSRLLYSQQKKNISDDWDRLNLTYIFESSKYALLKDRKQFIESYVSVLKKMYSHKIILWEEILKIRSLQSETDLLLENSSRMNNVSDSTNANLAESLPVLQLRPLPDLIDSAAQAKKRDTLLYYNRALLQSKHNVVNEMSLRPFIRYNYYDYAGQVSQLNSGNRDFLSAGLTFSMPLPFRNFQNKELRRLYSQQLVLESQTYSDQNEKYIRGLYAEYNEKLNDLNNLIYTEQILIERIRRENVKKSVGDRDYSPVYIARQLNEWYAVKYEILDTKEKLYFKLARILDALPDKKVEDIVIVTSFDYNKDSYVKDMTAFYMWSDAFEKADLNELVASLKEVNCKKLILSIDQNNDLKLKLLELLPLLAKNRIQTELMVSQNKFIYTENKEELLESVAYLTEIPGINGIHLDIEPHVIPELKDNRSRYLGMYETMVAAVSKEVKDKGLKLTISIPTFYSQQNLIKVFPLVDQVYLMAYENPDGEFIKRKISEEIKLDPAKVIISLRTKDFKSKAAMLDFIKKLKISTGINEFAIHDLKGFKELK